MDHTLDAIVARDAADPLASFREAFQLRDGLIYLDGNSLGALPRATVARMDEAVHDAWGQGLITSWLGADWVGAPARVGDKIARLIGGLPGEVIAADSTSINLFKALAAALSLRPDRSVILSESGNFPTDLYMIEGIERFSGGRVRSEIVDPADVLGRLDEDVAVLLLTQVHYKTGRIRDMATINRMAHDKGVLVVWDLSHSAGAIGVDLTASGCDFAVGCGYKFLNGGPGSPAFIYVARRHQLATPVLSGWFGHARPFAFEDGYDPAGGIERFLCGTPPILGLVALESGVDLHLQADMATIREKSLQLGALFCELMEARCADFGFELVSPRDANQRGSHISYAHVHGYEIMQALKAADVIGDFRTPDVLRFGITPLYLRHRDIYDAVERLREICLTRAWDRPEYRERAAVT
ncbi:kynureninase [Blastomonas sp.]|uniref:kynureninase n=1 Tax=Blastomonas sp. TaxID=1909299 RepID=UPI003593A4E3